MEQDNTGQDVAQNTSSGEQNSTNAQPYKVYTSEEEYKQAQDRFFKGAYNEGKSKVERDFLQKFSSVLGDDVSSIDDVIDRFQKINEPQKQKQSEVDELRSLLQEQKEALESARNEAQLVRMQANIANQFSSALSEISKEGELSIKSDYVEQLFYNEFEIDEQNGQYYVLRDGVAVLDDSGNRKSVGNAFKDFVRENKFLVPQKSGVGVTTGSANVQGEKPSRSEWRKLIRNNSPDAQQRVAEMYQIAKQVGWAE